MSKEKKQILRVIDVNFNRSKEGLRVIEDIYRFVLENDNLRKKARRLRHSLDSIAEKKVLKEALLCRDSLKDLGRHNDSLENKRSNPINILFINFQRIKESLRVLEEFLKLISPQLSSNIKKIRYAAYTLEKETLKLWPSLRDS